MALSLPQTIRLPLVIACAIAALTLFGRSPAGAAAPVFVDTFDDNRTNGGLWITDRGGTGPVIQEVNGRVEVSFPANSAGSEFHGQYVSRFGIRGDYDVSVDYELLNWPSENGVRLGIGGFANVHRVSLGATEPPSVSRDAYTLISEATPSFVRTPAIGASGSLRLVRSGSTATAYYMDSRLNGWVALGSLPVDSREAQVSLVAWSHDAVFADQPVKVAFDNFVLNAGELLLPVDLAGVELSSQAVVGSTSLTGTVHLTGPAPIGGLVVDLGATAPSVSVPATVVVPAGATSQSFQVSTSAVIANTQVAVKAAFAGGSRTASLLVQPVAVQSLDLSPPVIVGGGGRTVTATIHLNVGAAPANYTVTLASSSPAVAAPATGTVLVTTGSNQATFQVETQFVSVRTPVVITATLNGLQSTGELKVDPESAGAIALTSPNGGETWAPSSSHAVTWESSGVSGPVKLEYTVDDGATWSTVTDSTPNDGSHPWSIPAVSTTQARVRIFLVNNVALGDTSNGVFTIGVPSLTMIYPNGGEVWTGGTTETLNWSSANVSGSVKLEYSTDNGATWSIITASTANDGSEPWTIPNTATTQARVRISSLTQPSVSDTSNQPFRISVPSVTLTSPGGGESWSAGSTHPITWTSSDVTGSVKLEYSTNNGATWSSIAASTPNDGSHEWTVPATATREGRVRVTALAQPSATDTNDATFSIFLGTLALLSPNGGETWTGGTTHAITWNSTGLINAVQLEYTVNGGSNWTTITVNTPNDGSEMWTVPSVLTSQVRVRVSAVNGLGEGDISDSVFTISVAALHLISPNGGEVWDTRSTQSITWSSESVSGSVKLEYSPDGGTTWSTLVASTPNDGLHSWTLPNAPTSQGRIRVSEVDGTASDASDTTFTVRYVGGTLEAPTRVNFGAIKLGKSKTVAVTLSNTHRTEGLMVSLRVTGAKFLLSSESGPITIPPRKKLKVLIRCAPAARGTTTGQLLISSSDRLRPAPTVPLTGSGK